MFFWRSVVGKLWFTFLLVIFIVLAIISFFLLEFFEQYHTDQAQHKLLETGKQVSTLLVDYQDRDLVEDIAETIKDSSSRIFILYHEQNSSWISDSSDESLPTISQEWLLENDDFSSFWDEQIDEIEQTSIVNGKQLLISGLRTNNNAGTIFVYQSSNIVSATSDQTTRIILLAAAIAIVLMTIFAFFLSTRITAPLIKMREGALELAKGEFRTKIPILTHDEIGELSMAFNRMGRQLHYNIDALRQEKEQLYSILHSMADGVITINREGSVVVSNPPIENFLQNWRYQLNMDDEAALPDEMMSLMDEVITEESELLREVTIQGRNWVMIMSPLYDQTNVRGVVAVIRDMTEERKMDKLREEFIANVSHELRTPISLLQGYSEAIVDDIAESNEEKNELAQIIHDESLRMGRLVNELLDLARIKAGHIQLKKENIQVELFLDRIIRKFQGLATKKDIKLNQNNDNKTLSLFIDPDRMEQVFTNLIDNAIQHTQEHGHILVSAKDERDYIQFSIADNGSGIEEDDLPFVFERFYKADKSRKRQAGKKGTGLGLAIAKNIVEAHKGFITVQSKKNEGTSFTFRIPKNIK
ncbi:sensor histidine kinase ResE [Paraliobacillus quinghaiensis]|uniref:histidine kinase n=1 Tax=Paraliobacillus quinghaiensis TaxID=470815 RepID=A0A917THI4_9BACI|nr:ATP-binding protein [Paraliobacillus quinghaiensis]GGM22623.1 sensor histidine kinase ResE [Paraliobacillus quinghaiensis]